MKKLLAMTLSMAMLAGLSSGCGGGGATPASSTPPADASAASPAADASAASPAADVPAASPASSDLAAEITWWAFPTFSTTYAAGEYEQQMVDAFVAKNPNVKMKVEMIDFTAGPEKIAAAIQGGTAPDILFDAPGRIVDYGKNGKLASLDDLFTDEMKKDVGNENVLASCSDGTNYWMYPLSSAPFIMAYNKTVLEKEGLMEMVPTDGDRTWTTDEFTKLNEALAAKGYQNGIVFCSGQGGDQGTRAFIANLYSSSVTDKELTKYALNDANGVKGLQYCVDQISAGNLVNGSQYNGGESIEQFVSGKVTSTLLWAPVNEVNNADTMKANGVVPINLPLPSDDGKPELEFLVNGFGVFDSKDEAKITASKEFLKFVCDDAEWGPKNVLASKAFPVRQSFGNLYAADETMAFYAGMSKYYGTYYNTIDGFAVMRPAWFSNLQAALSGDKTAQQAMDDFAKTSNQSIADAKQ